MTARIEILVGPVFDLSGLNLKDITASTDLSVLA